MACRRPLGTGSIYLHNNYSYLIITNSVFFFEINLISINRYLFYIFSVQIHVFAVLGNIIHTLKIYFITSIRGLSVSIQQITIHCAMLHNAKFKTATIVSGEYTCQRMQSLVFCNIFQFFPKRQLKWSVFSIKGRGDYILPYSASPLSGYWPSFTQSINSIWLVIDHLSTLMIPSTFKVILEPPKWYPNWPVGHLHLQGHIIIS